MSIYEAMAKRADFKAVKKAVSMERLLTHYNLLDGLVQKGKSLKGTCPFCESGAFSVSLEKNAWQCFSCRKSGNVLDFAGHMEGVKAPREAAVFLTEAFSVGEKPTAETPTKTPRRKRKENVKKEGDASGTPPAPEAKPQDPVPEENPPLPFELQNVDLEHPTLEELGVSKGTLSAFRIGHYGGKGMFKGRIVFPIHNRKGELVAYGGINPNAPSERLYPPKYHRELDLFNALRAGLEQPNPLVIVEHPADVVALFEYGIASAVALMGEGMSESQANIAEELLGKRGRATLFLPWENPRIADTISKLIVRCHVRLVRFAPKKDSFVRFGEVDLQRLLVSSSSQ
jgi:DNA primase